MQSLLTARRRVRAASWVGVMWARRGLRHICFFKSGITYLWFPKCFLVYCYTIFLKIITKMEETKIQWKTSAPVVPVRAHLFTSHAYVSPCHLLTIWILIYIHIPPLPVALHPNTFPMGFAVCISLHPSLIWPRLWVEETSTWVSPIWIPL